MKRRTFLQTLLGAPAAVAVAKALPDEPERKYDGTEEDDWVNVTPEPAVPHYLDRPSDTWTYEEFTDWVEKAGPMHVHHVVADSEVVYRHHLVAIDPATGHIAPAYKGGLPIIGIADGPAEDFPVTGDGVRKVWVMLWG